ncbi:arylamine N-acetyltransferase 2-like [Osmerus eperlanus]|uniref:arylamine N-acetyltransferase 2-like n=1 Tax=Osmerus eperlanus TaxID=29151 RepID=UPI002E12FDB2
MDQQKYLHRIGYENPAVATLDVLRCVHRCHLMTVPFENLTVHSGGRVRLELPLLYNKIVNLRRGGFCFENNGIFSWLLSEIGFEVTLLSGQVRNSITGRYGPPFDHCISMVNVDGKRWLCHVGFGAAGFEFPISLENTEPQVQGHRVYRIRKDQNMHFLEWQDEENVGLAGKWSEIYKFTLEARCREDFTAMCDYHQNSPSSIFFRKSLCSILKPTGRLTYMGYKLITSQFPSKDGDNITKTTRELRHEEIPDILKEEFGIVLESPLIPKDEDITPHLLSIE